MANMEADPRRAEAFKMRQAGMKSADIAKHFGIKENTLAGWLYRERNALARKGLQAPQESGNSLALSPNIPALNQSGINTLSQSAGGPPPAGNLASEEARLTRKARKTLARRLKGLDVPDKEYQAAKDWLAQTHKETKGKPATEPQDERTAYRAMKDGELVERTLAAAVKQVGLDAVKGVLRRLEETGQLDNG